MLRTVVQGLRDDAVPDGVEGESVLVVFNDGQECPRVYEWSLAGGGWVAEGDHGLRAKNPGAAFSWTWVVSHREADEEPCPGEGRCHGCLAWCALCGDVAHVCDSGSLCDTHDRSQHEGCREAGEDCDHIRCDGAAHKAAVERALSRNVLGGDER